jgi:dipeptidyl aminopeptidase/acylaminoacyl peptidase
VTFAKDGKYVFATLAAAARAGARRSQDIVAYDLTSAQPQPYVLMKNVDPEDIVNAPGSIKTKASGNGIAWAMMTTSADAVYLQSAGYKADFRPRPFIDKVTIRNAQKQRLFEGSRDSFERPLVALDDDMSRMIISRETKSSIPDSFLWSKGDAADNLTRNKDPYPDITAAKRIDFDFTRQDGVVIHGRISLPTNYRDGTRVPAVYWDYPHEYATGQEYERDAIRSRNYNAYTPLSFLRWSDLWLTQGYALVYIDIPIVGKNNSYNDYYVSNLVDSVYASIRKLDQMGYIDVDRLGHGGHSYGAFTTGNLLAHSTFFKAGIAGDGAYNRTLTPMTFQNEKRMFWDAPTTYMEMSPFFYVDQINAPLLMYHAMEDDNSGTFPIQSFRMMQALTGLGKKAALYVYPFEAHSPRCKETYLDIWARWTDWFDTYVKKESRSSQ